MRRLLAALLVLLAATAVAGCGKEDVEQELRDARDRAEQQLQDAREKAEELQREADEQLDRAREQLAETRDRIAARLDEIIGGLDQIVPAAPTTLPAGRSEGNTDPATIDGFLTGVLESVDQYWTTTLQANGHPVPQVAYSWVSPGAVLRTACGAAADETAAFYCPTDDTIYIGQVFASNLFAGVAQGFPGEQAGYGHAAGDFAVAYVVAHEYAHNVQQELGVFASFRGRQARPFELAADCMAGTWANSVYEQGLLEPGDLEEALQTALAIGDFEVGSEQHHGTPNERREAFLAGYEGGDPSVCSRFVET